MKKQILQNIALGLCILINTFLQAEDSLSKHKPTELSKTVLKLYCYDTSLVFETVTYPDSTDTTYMMNDAYDYKDWKSPPNKKLNDATVIEIYRDKELKTSLATRIYCKGDSVYIKHYYRNGKLNEFDIQGRKFPELHYTESYYDNGQLYEKRDLSGFGKSPELVTRYWRNGKKKQEFWVYGPVIFKEYKEWYVSGALKVRGNYSSKNIEYIKKHMAESIEDGKWTYWKENGDVDKILQYEEGVLKK